MTNVDYEVISIDVGDAVYSELSTIADEEGLTVDELASQYIHDYFKNLKQKYEQPTEKKE